MNIGGCFSAEEKKDDNFTELMQGSHQIIVTIALHITIIIHKHTRISAVCKYFTIIDDRNYQNWYKTIKDELFTLKKPNL